MVITVDHSVAKSNGWDGKILLSVCPALPSNWSILDTKPLVTAAWTNLVLVL